MMHQYSRRNFIKYSSKNLLTLGILSYFSIPAGITTLHAHKESLVSDLKNKDQLTILNDRPINAETPPHLLDDSITPTSRHFVRNNGLVPDLNVADQKNWTLKINGNVNNPKTYTIKELKKQFEVVTKVLQLECGGNGRAFFDPPATGNQWTYGAISCSEWTGVRLSDVLSASNIKSNSIYTGHYSADIHLSGDLEKDVISRGIPISKALDRDNIIAFAMNGSDLPLIHGYPLRLICPGWPGSTSQKWLTRIEILDHIHDGMKMTGKSYKVPKKPIAPGTILENKDLKIIESMPIKSLITYPKNGKDNTSLNMKVRGHAWAGDKKVSQVNISIDYGATWMKASLAAPVNSHAWQDWNILIDFPGEGYFEIWARATDEENISQPFSISWNSKGYLNNSVHRIYTNIKI